MALFHAKVSRPSKDTDFHPPSLWRVKLCSILDQQTIIAKLHAYDWPCRIYFVAQSYVISSCLVVSRANLKSVQTQRRLHVSVQLIHSGLTAQKQRLSISYTTCTISAQIQHNKIIFLCNRHKLRAPLICSHIIKQSSCNISIWFVPDL